MKLPKRTSWKYIGFCGRRPMRFQYHRFPKGWYVKDGCLWWKLKFVGIIHFWILEEDGKDFTVLYEPVYRNGMSMKTVRKLTPENI